MVLDGVGAGALPDAAEFGDEGSDTLGNLSRVVDLSLPTLQLLGLGNLHPIRGVPPVPRPLALPGRLAERSAGKDTTNGHWEHMGLVTESPFPTYPEGFPEEVLAPFRRLTGRDVLGNKAASGTEIIAELGEEHVATGRPIVYTSADSVFQIASHVDVVPLEELYRMCRIARGILVGPHAVARVIARPFAGEPGSFYRTHDRKDFSLEPTGPTYLDLLASREVPVIGLGKIWQIFAGRGVREEHKVPDNATNLELLVDLLREGRDGLIFTNLVEFDMTWGHRNDVEGFAAGLAATDTALPAVLELLGPDDRLLITADHGVDPTTVSTDHSREYVPLLYYPRPEGAPEASYEGWMWDSGATVFAHLTREQPPLGGRPIEELSPGRGWWPYPHTPTCRPEDPCRTGPSEVEAAAAYLAAALGPAPSIAVVLGSGLDRLVASMACAVHLPYGEIPGWVAGRVVGHAGTLHLCTRNGVPVVALAGRAHGYEGFDFAQQQLPVRSLARWGVRGILLTNAAGGLDPSLPTGSLAVVTRILDLQTPRADGWPEELAATPLVAYGALAGLHLEGQQAVPAVTYAALPGPQYETAAEVEVLRGLGAQAVGMSTAAEVRAAIDEEMETIVVSVVTNPAGESTQGGGTAHAQVVDVSASVVPQLARVLDAALAWWSRVS